MERLIMANAWSLFYQFESRLISKIVDSSAELYSGGKGHTPQYTIERDGNLLIPPQHISWIGQTTLNFDDLAAEIDELKGLYIEARKTKIKRFPRRFPQLFSNVEQINVIKNTAFSSRPVIRDDGFFTLTMTPTAASESVKNDMDTLKNHGFEPRVVAEADQLWLQIPTESLFAFAGAEAIQVRRESGTAYRGTLRHGGESAGTRINIGFVIVDDQSRANVVAANEQAPRPHRLSQSGLQIHLPIGVPFELFKKA